MEGPSAVLNVITLPPGATQTQARMVLDGVRGAIFLYQNGGPLGALVGSWAISAGTDPYGNVYPQGFMVDQGVLSGVTINFANGYINSNGFFLYSSTPATGNLIATFTFASGTDAFSNKYLSGVTAYLIVAGTTYAMNLSLPNGQGFPGFSVVDVNHLPFAAPGVFAESSTSPNQAFAVVASGQATAADVSAYISVLSQIQSGVLGGQIVLQAGDVQHDINGNLIDYISNATGSPLVQQTSGDGQVYHIGNRAIRDNGVPHLINSTTPIITLTAANLLAGKGYHIVGWVTYIGGQAAGAPIFSWGAGSGLTLGVQQNGWQRFSGGGVVGPIHNNDGGLGAVTGPLFAANTTNWLYEFDIYVNVVNTGDLQINAAENTAGDVFTIHQAYATIMEYLCLSRSAAKFTFCMAGGILLSRCVHTTRLAGLPVHPGDGKASVGIKKESKHWIDVPCPTCQGGKRYNGGKNCPLCKGKKKIKVPPLDEKD